MMKTIHVFLLMFGALCCTCTTGFAAEAGSGHPVLEVRLGKGAKADLEEILTRTVAIRLYGVDLSSSSKSSARLIEPENVVSIVKILGEDCYEVDWVVGRVFYFVEPPLLEFLDIEGNVVGRVKMRCICSESDVRKKNNVMQDIALPDEQFLRLNELLEAPAQDAMQSIHVWRVGGKPIFEYRGARYTSPEQLKKHADLSKGVVVHLMRKTVSNDIRRLYKDLQEQGFKVEDMTAPHSNGPRARGSVLPIEALRN